MKRLLFLTPLLVAPHLLAQTPGAVPIAKEPHHHLVLENSYVRVFRVSVPAHDATLLHQHDVPYIYVALGPADFVNAVAGKPEVRVTMKDGQVGYSTGHFAHVARVEADIPFNNVTIELLHPQGEVHSLCAQVAANTPSGPCRKSTVNPGSDSSYEPQFETAEIQVGLNRLGPNALQTTIKAQHDQLLVLLSGSGIYTVDDGKPGKSLSVGQVAWIASGSHLMFSNQGKEAWSYLAIGFQDSSAAYRSSKPPVNNKHM